MLGDILPHAENVQYTSDYQYRFPTIHCNNLSPLPWSSACHTNNVPASYPSACHGGTPDSAQTVTRILSLATIRIRVTKLHTPRCIVPRKSTRYTFTGAKLGPRAGLYISKREIILSLLETAPRNRGCPRPSLPTISNDNNYPVCCNFYTSNFSSFFPL